MAKQLLLVYSPPVLRRINTVSSCDTTCLVATRGTAATTVSNFETSEVFPKLGDASQKLPKELFKENFLYLSNQIEQTLEQRSPIYMS